MKFLSRQGLADSETPSTAAAKHVRTFIYRDGFLSARLVAQHARLLQTPSTAIERLRYESCVVFENSLHVLIRALPGSCLRYLEFEKMFVPDDCVELLAQTLPHTNIIYLSLSGGALRTPTWTALFEGMTNSVLTSVALRRMHITAEVTAEFARCLRTKPFALKQLNMDHNPIGTEGVGNIADALPYTKLHRLHLMHVGLSRPNLEALRRAIVRGGTLRKLYIGANDIDISCCGDLAKLICATRGTLRELSLDCTPMQDSLLFCLLHSLPSGRHGRPVLARMYLRRCEGLTERACIFALLAMVYKRCIRQVVVSSTGITDLQQRAIYKVALWLDRKRSSIHPAPMSL